MAVKDTVTIQYMRQNEVFADAFNYYVYGGRRVIDPNSLVELDTREIGVPYGGEAGAEQPVQRIRDIIKSLTAMTDSRTAYLLLAIETQSNVHYAMPVKNMVYDALQYAKQVEKAIASHRKSGDYTGTDGDEFLSGFLKQDCLMPVVTLVVYFGAKAWDGPMSIHEMFAKHDPEILALVPDYKINLIAPALIPDEDFHKFSSTLREVLSFIKYSEPGDADKLDEIVHSDENFLRLGRKEVDVLNRCVNANLTMNEKEDVLDMCGAMQELARRAAEEAAGKTRIDTLLDSIRNMMKNLGLSADQSMNAIGVTESERQALLQLL